MCYVFSMVYDSFAHSSLENKTAENLVTLINIWWIPSSLPQRASVSSVLLKSTNLFLKQMQWFTFSSEVYNYTGFSMLSCKLTFTEYLVSDGHKIITHCDTNLYSPHHKCLCKYLWLNSISSSVTYLFKYFTVFHFSNF